jgi:hypothetical protein
MLAVQLEPAVAVPPVRYAWDADTEILSAVLGPPAVPPDGGASGSIEVQGEDGSWLSLELSGGLVCGAQVAVWPPVRRRAALQPPAATPGRAAVRLAAPRAGPVSLELSVRLAAEADALAGHVHFRLGAAPVQHVVRIADRLLLELDARDRLAGLWLLNVPPIPTDP